jgi:parvulin-like peptidyl-prolyl isomerase
MLLFALALVLAACGNPASQTVARVDGVTLTRQDIDAQIARIEKGFESQAGQGIPLPSKLEIEQEIVNRFINQTLTLSAAKTRGIAVSDEEVNAQIEQFRGQIEQSGTTLEQAVQEQLGFPSVESTEFRQFVSFFVAQRKLGESLVSDAQVRERITTEVMAETQRMVPVATVAHILVATEEEANAVIERLDTGEEFGVLAAELSQDPGSAQNGGVYENIAQGQFVPEFEQAMFVDLEPGETTETPVQTQFGYHIIRLISRTEGPALSAEDAQMQIEQRVAQEVDFERQQAVQELVDTEREKAVAENRIQEPTFPTATPLPAPVAPETAPQPTPTP